MMKSWTLACNEQLFARRVHMLQNRDAFARVHGSAGGKQPGRACSDDDTILHGLSFPHDDSPPRDLFGIFCIREAVRDGLSKNAAEFCLRSRV